MLLNPACQFPLNPSINYLTPQVAPNLSYPPKISVSDLVKRLTGRSPRLMPDEFAELKRRYWGQHLWGIGYGAWGTGNITDKMVQEYLNHQKNGTNSDQSFILE